MFSIIEFRMHLNIFSPNSSKRVKKPAKMGTAIIRSRVVNVKEEDDMEEEEAADGLLYEIVEECP